MQPLGFHSMIELFECDPDLLADKAFVEKTMREAVKLSHATEIGFLFQNLQPSGVSGLVLIAESHFSIHTWPERKYAAVDLFSCSEKIDIDFAFRFLATAFKAKRTSVMQLKRGIDLA